MRSNSFEHPPASEEKAIRDELELLHRRILDTEAEIAQVKEDAVKDPSRVRELVSLKTILDSLQVKEQTLKYELEDLKHSSV
ncbi:MAG TPA: hypothetical protein VMR99_02390 [Candidatus Paceibacterota bacterium]|nr:hypothetical protein [Candidatus Paceibacterota bacterium]